MFEEDLLGNGSSEAIIIDQENYRLVDEGRYDLTLEKVDSSRMIAVVCKLKGLADLGLKDAKDLVESAPKVLLRGANADTINNYIETLVPKGATLKVNATTLANGVVEYVNGGNVPDGKYDLLLIGDGQRMSTTLGWRIHDVIGCSKDEGIEFCKSGKQIIAEDVDAVQMNEYLKRIKTYGYDDCFMIRVSKNGSAGNGQDGYLSPDKKYNIKLNGYDNNKSIELMVKLKEMLNCGLSDVASIIEECPCIIKKDVLGSEAEEMIEVLESCGAVIQAMEEDDINDSLYNVILEDYCDSKMSVIRAIKSFTGLGLVDSKELTESCPCVIKHKIVFAEATNIKNEIIKAGGKSRVEKA